MSIFEEQKRAVADMLDYLLHVQDIEPPKNDKILLEIYTEVFHKAKVGYGDVDEILYWMEDRKIVTIEHRCDPDDYFEELDMNDGMPVPAFKVSIDQHGRDAIARLAIGESAKAKGLEFDYLHGELRLNGEVVHTFHLSKPPYRLFKKLWDHSLFASSDKTRNTDVLFSDLSRLHDEKKVQIERRLRDINQSFSRKQSPIPLKISINGDLVSLIETGSKD